MSGFKRETVVVPIDFSDASRNATRAALELTGDLDKLHLVHVLPPLETISPAVVWGELSDEKREESVHQFARNFLDDEGLEDAQLEVRIGSPAHEITEYADQINADLIVISSHGYHGLKRMIMGSVAESVIRHANCAVLVMRRQDAE